MSGRIDDEKIEEIRNRLDIVEVVGSYLPLRRSGHNHLGLCPFHGEKSPSFNVNAVRQIFHCFGCGVGGNVFNFVMRMEGLTFPEAVRRLGERVGIEVAQEAPSPAELKRRHELELFGRINEAAALFYQQILLEDKGGAVARSYLKKRGYDGEAARRFRLGYATDRRDGLTAHLAAQGFDLAAVARLGLIRDERSGSGHFDLFRRRLLFPILDERGRVAAFGGRVLDDGLPKYLNSPESPIYHKGNVLYGLYQAREEMRKSDSAIVVEGYFDLMALHRAGFTASAATCGTALTVEQVRLLKRYAGRVLLLFDQDPAGLKATFRGMDVLLAERVSAAVIELPSGDDPDSFLLRAGAEAFAARLQAARPVLELFMETTLARHGATIEGKAKAVEEISAKLKLLPSELERNLYLKLLAQRTGIDESLLLRRTVASAKAAAAPTVRAAAPPAARAAATARKNAGPGSVIRAQELLLQMMVSDRAWRLRAAVEGVATLFSEAQRRGIAEVLLRQDERGEVFSLDAVFNLLSEEQSAILSGILVNEQQLDGEGERIFADCRGTSVRGDVRRRSSELQQALRQAESDGDEAARNRCLQELMALKKRL
ncbi:MAG: DNA primase [Desulfuromonadales bacterium GWC2_61_20]|nr:MAG: DNA primase [Desulfuromonadales bacterium GWC2_61_20]HAD03179.1 DNA primase [Desulfuromonas sp.]